MAGNFCLQKIKQFTRAFDMFSSSVILRYNEQQQHKTIIGGIFSIAIIVIVCLMFAKVVIETFSLDRYTIQISNKKNLFPPLTNIEVNSDSSKFMFGIQILPLNLSDSKSYFNVTLSRQILNYGITVSQEYLDLQQCTEEHWKNYQPLVESFKPLNVSHWLCPTSKLSSLSLEGKYTSQRFSQYQVKVSPCKNSTNSRTICRPSQQINKLFSDRKNIIYFTVYFINPILNPSQKRHISYYLEDQNYAIFGPNIGTQNYLLFTDYSINSDYSIFPFSNNEQQKGAIVQNSAQKFSFQTKSSDGKFISFYFAKSSNSLSINRSVQKITLVFAFIEGTIVAFIALCFILKLYANFSFQITLAYNMFEKKMKKSKSIEKQFHRNNEKLKKSLTEVDIEIQLKKKNPNQEQRKSQQAINQQKHAEQNNFNLLYNQGKHEQLSFLSYVLYPFYKLCNFCGRNSQWQEMSYIQECQTEMKKQLDIKSLLNRIVFLQFCSTYVLQNYQLEGLKQIRPKTAQQIKTIRQKCQNVMSKQTQKNKNIKNMQKNTFDKKEKAQRNQYKKRNQPLQSPIHLKKQFPQQSNKIQTQQKKSQLLNKLRYNAQQGNQLSAKIWRNLIEDPHYNGQND